MIESEHTAQGFVTTDLDDNQIWAFHPGAMGSSHLNRVQDAGAVTIGIVAPDGRDGMVQHAAQFAAGKVSGSCSTRDRVCRCSTARSCGPSSSRRPGWQ